ncbi:hypothetical protein HanHA300_Chr02g0064391 [Helianthus annuus]|nr:hypothetical protein HanHA300_Chr02g0064391 [Helianthus annuus]KAJ0619576.1 hypothetical protein HanHA89_Chr02g0072841 [Helianthus annuus]KAJ0778035.1 hypothetical protein HanLR1_Chr02g0067261 [Helianthus annuus]KAJ0787039.1 hypothetical protein HanOQP8_Chr02g0078041 [Helianthus annuus]
MYSMMAAASIWPGWCLSLWVKWSVNSGFPCITSAKIADNTSDNNASTLASNNTMDAIPDPTAVPLTSASPSLGCNSKNPPSTPAWANADSALRTSPAGPTAFELGRPVRRPAM